MPGSGAGSAAQVAEVGFSELAGSAAVRGAEQADGRATAAIGNLGGERSLVLAGIADAPGARLSGGDRSDHVAHGVEATGLCVEAHALQLEKKRDPERFERAQVEIDELIRQAQAGEIELAYVDEAGFAPQPPNRSAWSPVGDTHAVVSKRSQRLNVIGALLSSGRLMMAKLWQSVNGLWFFGFLIALIERVNKPMVVILENASIHMAKALEPYCELLKGKGMRF